MRWRQEAEGASHEGRAWLACLPALAVLLTYARTLRFGPITDDRLLLLENPYLAHASGFRQLVTDDLWHASAAHQHTEYYRPLVMLGFWIQSQLHGISVAWFRLGNVALFALAAALAGPLLKRRLPRTGWTAISLWVTVWALHPLHTEAVVWLSGRFDVALLLGAVLTLLGNTLERRALWVPLALLLALGSKEVAVVLIPALWADDVESRRGLRAELPKYAAVLGVAALYFALRAWIGVATLRAGTSVSPLDWARSYGTLVSTYVRLLVWPADLDVHRWYASAPPVLLGGVALALTAVTAVVASRLRRGLREGLTGFVLAFGSLVPVALIGPNQHVYGDRFAGLFTLGLLLALAPSLSRSTMAHRAWVALPLLAGEVVLGQARISEWKDEDTLRRAALAAHPDHVYWRVLEAHRLLERGRPAAALLLLEGVRKDAPDYPKVENAACVAELRLGELDAAAASCRRALLADQGNPSIWLNGASVALNRGDWGGCVPLATQALSLRAPYAEADYVLGVCLANLGREPEALEHTERGLTTAPEHPGLRDLAAQLRAHRRAEPRLPRD